jgi:class 3 adenylate cyclase
VLITGATRELMTDSDRLEVEARDSIPLKGKTESIELYALRSATSAASAARRPA